MIGRTLGHYEVTAALGKGGMGEVYRATDTRLGRDVALKFLPRELADDPERSARFDREARTLASLQHPNIASIYGFESVDGVAFLAMELAEGEDLATVLRRGRLATADALKIGLQIAKGLSAAHEQGIVHRDLKPANVMIGPEGTAEGRVKLLDFGLARGFDEAKDGDPSLSPTITAAMTQAGTILGTAAYMSPEQARGRSVDRRTDVWAFGAVLFEMLTGRVAFPGEVVSDVIAKILEREPQWDELAEDTHPLLRRLLLRCLAKEPGERFHDMADVRLEIEAILGDPTGASFGVSFASIDPEAMRTTGAKPSIGPRIVPWVVAVGLAVALGASLLGREETPREVVEFEIAPPAEVILREFSVAPDGRGLAFVTSDRTGTSHLWLRRFDDATPERLAGTEGAFFPFWSGDGSAIGFFDDRSLKRIDVADGNIRTLAPAPNGRGGAWSDDGVIVFAPEGQGPLMRIAATGGESIPVTTLVEDEHSHRFPHFLPDERRFTYSAHGAGRSLVRRYVTSLDDAETVRLPDGMSETYVAGEHLLYVRERSLVTRTFDPGEIEPLGDEVSLAASIDEAFPRTGRASFSVSDDDVLAYLQRRIVLSQFQWFDRSGRPLETVGSPDHYANSDLSPDGRRLIYADNDGTGSNSIWMLDLVRNAATRVLHVPDFFIQTAHLMNDGRHVVFGGTESLRVLDIRSRESRTLVDVTETIDGRRLLSPRRVSSPDDGRFIVFDGWDPTSDFDLWMLDMEDGTTPRPVFLGSATQGAPEVSPDGRWVAYQSNETGRNEVYVCTIDGSERSWVVSTDGGSRPAWNAAGTEILYLANDDRLMVVDFAGDDDVPEIGVPDALFRAPSAPSNFGAGGVEAPTLVSIDGDRFLFHVHAEAVSVRSIRVVLGWRQWLDR